jgi:hypothetical protein
MAIVSIFQHESAGIIEAYVKIKQLYTTLQFKYKGIIGNRIRGDPDAAF